MDTLKEIPLKLNALTQPLIDYLKKANNIFHPRDYKFHISSQLIIPQELGAKYQIKKIIFIKVSESFFIPKKDLVNIEINLDCKFIEIYRREHNTIFIDNITIDVKDINENYAEDYGIDLIRDYAEKEIENLKKTLSIEFIIPIERVKLIYRIHKKSLSNYIFLSKAIHGGFSNNGLLISKEVKHKGKTWNECHKLLNKEDCFMLDIRRFIDFVLLLKSGEKVLDGNGDIIPREEVDTILDSIIGKKKPSRGEWLNARFEEKNNKIFLITKFKPEENSNISEIKSELNNCLMKDCYINLENCNSQGLPIKESKNHEIYYFPPRDSSVAWFWANSDRVDLDCIGNAGGSNSDLGVRPAKILRK